MTKQKKQVKKKGLSKTAEDINKGIKAVNNNLAKQMQKTRGIFQDGFI